WIIRNAASCGHARHERAVPRGARTLRAETLIGSLSPRLATGQAVTVEERLHRLVPRGRGLARRRVVRARQDHELRARDPRRPLARALDGAARLALADDDQRRHVDLREVGLARP